MIIVGLTGGIATGKSTVARIFSQAGARVIDADRIARQVVTPGQPAWQEIVDYFGETVLQPDRTIDRAALGNIIFNDTAQQAMLNRIVHPRVFDTIEGQIEHIRKTAPGAVVILDIPLLLETGMHQGLAEIIVVYTPETVQLERLMKRDGLPRRDALSRIRSQMPIEEKRRRATLVIDNSGGREATRRQAMAIYRDLTRRV